MFKEEENCPLSKKRFFTHFFLLIFSKIPGTCVRCQTKYFSDIFHKYEIVEGKHRKEFCSESCLTMHMREDTSAMSCSVCRHRMKFYDCIRRNCDNRCFCSLQCALAAETRIELLMHNDEPNLISQLALQPERKFDAFDQGKAHQSANKSIVFNNKRFLFRSTCVESTGDNHKGSDYDAKQCSCNECFDW